MHRLRFVLLAAALVVALGLPLAASAHEVYVLSPAEVRSAMVASSPNPFGAVPSEEKLFLVWSTITAVAFLLVLTASITPVFENVFDPFLLRLKKYAPLLGRLTFGVSIFASGYFGDFFGPELPVSNVLGATGTHIFGYILMAMGILVCLGFLTRLVSCAALCIFAFTIYEYHWYMLTYVNYLGEMILFTILGGGIWSLDRRIPVLVRIERAWSGLADPLEKYSFLILRILFGTAVFFASFYAKFLHSNLALDTVNEYHLTNYFHFTPLFLVLGAFIIEALIGLCIMLGFEIRFAALVFTFFITLSVMFFGEAVWPHVILFGVNLTLFAHGYDAYTLEMKLLQRARKGEPVL